jgi:YegS/Rv2252/BmrU family lipid kinase
VTERRALFVVNPAAGGGRAARLVPLVQAHALRNGGNLACTTGPGNALDLARRAADDGFEVVVAVGGDGTLNEVANGLLASKAVPLLGAIPAGTGNDFVRSLGLPSQPRAALEVLHSGVEHRIDVGQCNGRFFLNACGVGFDARVARAAQRFPRVLKVGTLPYVAAVVLELTRKAAHDISIELGERRIERRSLMVAVANGAFYGGGMMIAPHASRADGLLDLCIVGDVPRREVLRLLSMVFSGRHIAHPRVELHRTRQLRIASASGLDVQMDGELVARLPARFEVKPNALRVIVPSTIG